MWASAHHDGICWCNQLVAKLAEMMLRVAIDVHSSAFEAGEGTTGSTCGVTGPAAGMAARSRLVMRRVRSALVGAGSLYQQLLPTGQGGGQQAAQAPWQSGSAIPQRDLSQALKQAHRRQCAGANLAWYLQYNTPKLPTKQALLQLRHTSIKVSTAHRPA